MFTAPQEGQPRHFSEGHQSWIRRQTAEVHGESTVSAVGSQPVCCDASAVFQVPQPDLRLDVCWAS